MNKAIGIFIMSCFCFVCIIAASSCTLGDHNPETTMSPVPSATFVYGSPTPTPDLGEVINFNDVNLERVIRQELNISNRPVYVSDVEDVTVLRARVCGIIDIDVLRHFTSLEVLDLYGNRINNLEPLSGLANLKVLNISQNFNIIYAQDASLGLDLTPLAGLTGLLELSAAGNMITELSSLAGLVNLTRLELQHNRIDDILPLALCVEMRYIDLSYNYGVRGFLTERGISDIRYLREMTKLEYIDVSNNIITSIESLQDMQNLKYLYFEHNYVTSINCLAGNNVIEVLNCAYNRITDIDAATEMRALREFNYEGNNIMSYFT